MEPTPPTPTPSGTPPPVSSTAPPSSSAEAASSTRKRPPPLPQLVTELRDLVVSYFKQQTILPLKQLGRYIGFGILGSLLLGFGVLFLAMSGLRALQDETGDTFTGDWSWVPYLIMFGVLLFGAALVWVVGRANRGPEKEFG
jgi:hypothetical protein